MERVEVLLTQNFRVIHQLSDIPLVISLITVVGFGSIGTIVSTPLPMSPGMESP